MMLLAKHKTCLHTHLLHFSWLVQQHYHKRPYTTICFRFYLPFGIEKMFEIEKQQQTLSATTYHLMSLWVYSARVTETILMNDYVNAGLLIYEYLNHSGHETLDEIDTFDVQNYCQLLLLTQTQFTFTPPPQVAAFCAKRCYFLKCAFCHHNCVNSSFLDT